MSIALGSNHCSVALGRPVVARDRTPWRSYHFANVEELEEALARRCVALQHQRRDLIRSATRFHWWPPRITKRQGPKTT